MHIHIFTNEPILKSSVSRRAITGTTGNNRNVSLITRSK